MSTEFIDGKMIADSTVCKDKLDNDANAKLCKVDNITASSLGLGNVKNVDQTNAANLSSGYVPVGRFGGGSPTASTFLRGDHMLANPIILPNVYEVGSYTLVSNYVPVGTTISGANYSIGAGTWRCMGSAYFSQQIGESSVNIYFSIVMRIS